MKVGGHVNSYTTSNQLAVAQGNNGLAYDPLGRLFNGVIDPGVNTTLLYDGAEVVTESDQNSGALLRRYVYGPGSDEPLIWWEGASFGDRRWLHADERGSIVAVTNDSGSAIAINAYDDYGIPKDGNLGRFQYTGQKWLPTVGLYDYKARAYSPTLGRFMQTDPIGYGDGMNMYAYTGNNPVNRKDPTGLYDGDIVVCGGCGGGGWGGGFDFGWGWGWDFPSYPGGGFGGYDPGLGYSGQPGDSDSNSIVVTGRKPAAPSVTSSIVFNKALLSISGPQNDDIVVVARRTTRLPNVLPRTLWSHFLGGSGDTVCLTQSQFSDLASAGKRVGNLAPRAGGGYAQQTSYYGGDYANSFGTATLYLDGDRNATGFHDFYNFDAHGRTSASAQAKTAIGALGYLAGGKDFSVDYNNGDCR